MSERPFDAIVVGAGIAGAACAKELTDAGFYVAICERNDYSGGGATAAGMGHLAVMDDSEAQFALTAYSQELWRELSGELPADAEYLPCGSLWVAADAEEFEEAEGKYRFYSERNIPVEILDGRQVAEAEPHLRPVLAGALLMSADSVCYPPCAARYLSERVVAEGGKVFFDTPVIDVSNTGVRTKDGSFLPAGFKILATGTEITKLNHENEVRP